MKTGAIVGFCFLGAAVAIALVVFVYHRKITMLNKNAKAKFAGRLGHSFVVLSGDDADRNKRRAELINKFDQIDVDGNGLINKEEMWEYVSSKENQNMTKQEYDALFKQIDNDGSGEIDFAEFALFMNKVLEENP